MKLNIEGFKLGNVSSLKYKRNVSSSNEWVGIHNSYIINYRLYIHICRIYERRQKVVKI